jgi:hypothetical protein
VSYGRNEDAKPAPQGQARTSIGPAEVGFTARYGVGSSCRINDCDRNRSPAERLEADAAWVRGQEAGLDVYFRKNAVLFWSIDVITSVATLVRCCASLRGAVIWAICESYMRFCQNRSI